MPLMFTARPGHRINWDVVNNTTGTQDQIPGTAIEGPTGGARSTVRAIVLRKTLDGVEYYDVQNVPERFASIRRELVEALDGSAENPLSLAELIDKAEKSMAEFVQQSRKAATVDLAE